MAQLTGTQITIGGNPVLQYSSFQLTQGIFAHHHFRLVCPAESIDGTTGNVFNQSKNLMGANLTAQISAVGMEGELKFSGIVMQVETARFSGHSGDVIITGYSPTIILDNGPHCKSWEKKAVKNIAQDVLKHFPQNLLNPKVNTTYPETLAYTVQYKETAWQFLSRLCATYGEWLYYDGQALLAGPPANGGAVNLTFGSNLSRFNMVLEVRPARSQSMAYDYMNHDVYKSEPSNIEGKAGLNELGKHALQASNTVYGTQPKAWNNNFITNKKQLDDVVNMRAAMQSSNGIRFNGSSGHPGIKVGGQVSVQGQNVFSLTDESFGEYIVIAVNHYADGQGNYNNDFVAVPSTIKVPPVAGITEPNCETQSAMVTDNHDLKGLGRIRAKFHWMNGAEKTPWIRVTSPHGGGGKGMFFIPEIGEEVIVGFEGDSAVKPYVIGTVYHGKANNSYSNGGNDVKALQTRSGNKIIMNDAQGSNLIEDPSGNSWLMDGQGNTRITAPADINMNIGKNLNIDVASNMHVNIGNDLTFNVGNQALLNVFQKMLINTPILLQMVETFFHTQAGKALIHSASEIKIESPEMYIAGSQKLFLHSDESAVLNSKGIAEMKGKEKNNFNNEPTSYEVAAKKELEIKLIKTTFLPLGIVDFDGKMEKSKIDFEITVKEGSFSKLTFKINHNGKELYVESIPKPLAKGEKYTIVWDGFSSDKIYDSTWFLNGKLTAEVTDGTFTSQLKIIGEYKIVKWIDVKIDDNSKKIEIILRVNLQKGTIDKEAGKTFEVLLSSALEGVRKHWARNKSRKVGDSVKIKNSEYQVFINPINTEENSMPELPISTTNSTGDRSRNWILSRHLFFYNKGSKEYYLDTSAHEVGHEILRAFAGFKNISYSYLHKGTSTWDQDIKEKSKLPTIEEIDLMNYFSDDKTEKNRIDINFYERRVADAKDVLGLLWCSQLIVSIPV